MRGEDHMRSRIARQIEVYWIRHGKTPSNERKCYLGRTEEELSETGRRELSQKKEYCPRADLVVGSPMLRCVQTAELLYPGQKMVTVSDWREMDFGIFEGKNYRELSNEPEYQAWIDSNAVMPIPRGESRQNFVKRCQSGMQEFIGLLEKEISSRENGGSSRVAAIVHGGTIMALLSSYDRDKRDYFAYSCGNGEGYRCILCWEYAADKQRYLMEMQDVKSIVY